MILTLLSLLKSRATFLIERISPHYKTMVTYHQRMDDSVPDGAVIFIGDSITQGLAVAAVTPLAVNYGIGKDTTVGVLDRIPLYRSLARAEAVVLAIGVNDLRQRDNAEILANFKSILERIPSNVPVIISAILPVDLRIWPEPNHNQRIQQINAELDLLCDTYPTATFVDSRARLVESDQTDPAQNLAAQHHIGDGIHLSTAGYAVWIEDLRAALGRIRL